MRPFQQELLGRGTQHRQERVIKEALSEEMTLEGREL